MSVAQRKRKKVRDEKRWFRKVMDESEWLSRKGSVNQIEMEKKEEKGDDEEKKKRDEMGWERCCLRVDIISNLYFLVMCT